MELLYTFIECSIAILAFASIVAQFKKSTSVTWNVHQYQGIIAHSVQAFVYSCLPLLLIDFPLTNSFIWVTCTLLLGIVTIIQASGVLLLDKVSTKPVKIIMFSLAFFVLLLQLSYVFGILKSAIAVYKVGVFWHIFQSIILILSFILHAETEQQSDPK